MNLKSLLKNMICALLVIELLILVITLTNNKSTQKLLLGKRTQLAESTIIEFNEGVGENLTATLNTETGELRITGTGKMTNWSLENESPWYSYREKIKTVVIENGVTSIGKYAFLYCSSLAEINIPEGITSIGESAFSKCSSLAEINIPEGVTSIGESAFYECSSLAKINIPAEVTSIDWFAFYKCSSLSKIELPSSVTSIDSGAFDGCSSLREINVQEGNKNYSSVNGILFNKGKTEIIKYPQGKKETNYNIPEGVTSIGKYAFFECSSLSQINIPEGVTTIGGRAFRLCRSLSKIELPSSVTRIAGYAFNGCSSLTKIKLPSSVTSIEDSVFGGCSSLAEINVQEENKNYSSVNGILFNKEKTEITIYPAGKKETSYNIPERVISIGRGAFEDCSSLAEINIPEGVTSIGPSAFAGCSSLSKIELPSSAISIGFHAFWECSSLTEINIPEGVTSIGGEAFWGCSSLTINCRSNSYAKEYAVSNNINYTEINPEIISITGNAEEWTHEDVTLKVEAKDDLCGLAEEAYSFNGGTTWQKENTKTYSQNTEGIVIKVKTKDGVIATYGETIDITKITKEHVATGEFIINREATCEKIGSKYKQCVVKSCDEKLEITQMPALGHDWEKKWILGKFTGTGICTRCGEECKHEVWEKVTLDGHACKECDKYETHTWDSATGKCTKCQAQCTHTNWKAATCEEPKTCTTCGKTEGQSLGGHKWNATTGTCEVCKQKCTHNWEENGTECSICHMQCEHNIEKWLDNPDGDCHVGTCTICGSIFVENHTFGDVESATCEEDMKCTKCEYIEEKALGHDWDAETGKCKRCKKECTHEWNKETGICKICNMKCTHSWKEATCEAPKTCERCGKTEGEALGHNWKEATCETAKTCERCGETEGEALGHSWKEATCEEPKTCKRCGKVEGKAKGHTEVIDKKVEPTCTQSGLTEGKHCSVCNKVLQAQTKISALGHDYKSVVTKPTTTKQGYTTHTCTRCGDSYKDSYTAPIEEPESLYIASSIYNVGDKYISKIKAKTTVKTLKEKLSTNATNVTISNKGTTLKETDYIGTGMKITFKLGEETKEYTLVVTGDITGDGKLQNGDLIKLVRYRVELITLEEPYKLAADVNGDSRVTDSDIIVIARVLVNLREL